tara:strand:+ start:1017 stop:2015 length:999 start_codon:yes stop_codon:yes gene_type:complete
MEILFYSIILLTNYLSLKLYIKIAKKNNIVALGNNKNLHSGKIPRGAGIIFGVTYIVLITFAYFQKHISFEHFLPISISSIFCLILGFWDDIKDLGITIKMFGQLFIVTNLIYLVYGFSIFNHGYVLDYVFNFFIIFAVLWMLNAYNFLDGSDGHLGTVASMQCLLVGILMYISNQFDLIWPVFLLFLVMMVFLIFNWSPALVFMGDSGSLFIGINMITFTLISYKLSILTPYSIFIILSYFFIDTFGTLILRVCVNKSWKQRHRSHPYQNFSRIYSHQKTSMLVIIYHLIWLLPLLILVVSFPDYALIFCVISIFPTFFFLIKYGPLFSSD